MNAAERANDLAERTTYSPAKLFKRYRRSIVPLGGWKAVDYSTSNADALLSDVSDVVRLAKLRGIRSLNDILTQLLEDQVANTIDEAMAIYGRTYGTTEDKTDANPEFLLALWLLAIDQSMRSLSMEIALNLTPAIQSVVDDIYNKAMDLLGAKPNTVQLVLMTNRAKAIAKSLESIVSTTTDRMHSTVEMAIAAEGVMTKVVEVMRQRMGIIASNRVNTILRTEIGRAADEATLSAYKDSNVVSHVSVVGCQAIENGIPTYAGVPTCNIKNVPIADARRLKFHPNHTGMIVPSAFYDKNGNPPKLQVERGRA